MDQNRTFAVDNPHRAPESGLTAVAARLARTRSFAAICVALLSAAATTTASSSTLVVCAPGYPGSTAEAQPAMDDLASATAAAAGLAPDDLTAVYFETEEEGLQRLAQDDAVLALVTLPFFLEHRQELGLTPRAQAVPSERAACEPWSLVAGAEQVETAADLEGVELVSLAGHSPRFLRGPVLGEWGELPDSVTITFSGAVLSALRKASRGEAVALVLDAHQTASLDRLPFANKLEVVHSSPPLPVSLLCSVGQRLSEKRTTELVDAFLALGGAPEATEALAGVRIDSFVAVDRAPLEHAVELFEAVTE